MAGRRTLNAPPKTSRTGTGPVGAAHVSVMMGEVVEWLRPRPGACLVDATVGVGGPTAAEIVNHWPESRLARLIAEYGEERRARAVARAVVRARPLGTTGQLAAVVSGVLGRGRAGIHPATRTFQALRIAVNDELGGLDRFLADGYRLLRPEGRLAVLSYHSLEDRRGADAVRVLRLVRGLPRHALLLSAFLLVLCVARVWLRLETVNLGYELSSARQMQLRLEHESQELQVEIATLRDPARIADIARRRLGMRDPEKGQVVVLP